MDLFVKKAELPEPFTDFPCPTLCEECVGSLTSHRVNKQGLSDGISGL